MAYMVNSRTQRYYPRNTTIYDDICAGIDDKEFLYQEVNNFTSETSIEKPLDVYKIAIDENVKSLYLKCLDNNDKEISRKRFKNTSYQSTEENNVQ